MDTAAVELPGAGATESWDVDATLTKNYSASGLASDPNARERAGRNARDDANDDEGLGKVAAGATTNGDVARGDGSRARGRRRDAEEVDAETNARGESARGGARDDLEAMRMDRRRNAMQHRRDGCCD